MTAMAASTLFPKICNEHIVTKSEYIIPKSEYFVPKAEIM